MALIHELEINYLQYEEQASAPATPPAGMLYVYAKTDGKWYSKNSAGTESEIGADGLTLLGLSDFPANYTDAAGKMLVVNEAETAVIYADVPVIPDKSISASLDGDMVVETNACRFVAPMALTIKEVLTIVGTAPTGADLIVDVNKNGTTIFTTQDNRPTIAAGTTSDTSAAPDVTAVAKGDIISIDIDQIGSTVAGADLALSIVCEVA